MANWCGQFRSNYVVLKGGTLEILQNLFPDLGVFTGEGQHEGKVALYSEHDCGETPSLCDPDPEQEDDLFALGIENADNIDDVGLLDVIQHCLPDGETFVWIQSGAEKLRYVSGYAVAITNQGVQKEVHLTDIYEGLPEGTTRAEY